MLIKGKYPNRLVFKITVFRKERGIFTMRKLAVILMAFCLLLTAAGCSKTPPAAAPNPPAPPAAPATPPASADPSAGGAETVKDSGLTLAQIRKAAVDSGYTVSDDYQNVFLKDVKGGFAVQIVADNKDVVYSVLECGSEDAAIQNAGDIDKAGYSIAVRNGKFLTSYGADNKDGTVKDILASILEGKPAPVKTAAAPPAAPEQTTPTPDPKPEPQSEQPKAEQTQPAPAPAPAPGQSAPASITGTWASSSAAGKYNAAAGKYEGISGMGLLYTFQPDGTFAQLTIFGKYIFTTGKYSIKDDVLTLTERVCIESNDNGATWGEKEKLPDASSYFATETGDAKTLLLGQEGAKPPLSAPNNAMKFSFKE